MTRKEVTTRLTDMANEVQGDIDAYERKVGQLRQGMVHLRKCDMYVAKGDLASAARESADAVKYLPDCIDALRSAADAHFSIEQYSTALSFYSDLIKNFPSQKDIRYQMGRCYTELKDWPKAIPEYEREMAVSGEAPDIHLQLGLAYQKIGEQVLNALKDQRIADGGRQKMECRSAFTKAKEHYAKGSGGTDQENIKNWINDIDATLNEL
jgi:tetratricopeptide (TPR) repeat protein